MATLPKMKPRTFYDLAVEVALIRPGPIQGQSVHPYLRRRNGEEPVRYPHPLTRPILQKTMGVPIFQEQLMELARVCAGFDGGQSDRLRQAMTHKRSEKAMERLREEVFAGMASKGVVGAAADEIWEKLQGFAHFGFPESHSVSFAYIVYMSAWLKYHWPAETLAGLLNAQPMGFYSPNSLVQDARRHGVEVLEPCINRSFHDCTIEGWQADPDDVLTYYGASWRRGRGALEDPVRPAMAVRLGLRYVRNLGVAEIDRIEAARQLGGHLQRTRRSRLPHRTVDRCSRGAGGGRSPDRPRHRKTGRDLGGWCSGRDRAGAPSPVTGSRGSVIVSDDQRGNPSGRSMGDGGIQHPSDPVHQGRAQGLGLHDGHGGLELRKNGVAVEVGGVVTHRQRPGTAAGVIFFNLEDETGTTERGGLARGLVEVPGGGPALPGGGHRREARVQGRGDQPGCPPVPAPRSKRPEVKGLPLTKEWWVVGGGCGGFKTLGNR